MTNGNKPSWFRPLRRQDRRIADEAQLWDILRSADVCRIALCDDDWPYIVPMNFGCLDGKLYFHSAREGLKLDLLTKNPNVCFEVDVDVEILPGAQACGWSARFRSIVGFGRICLVEDPEEKREGIKALVAQYTDREIDAPAVIPENTAVLRLDVHQLTGKQSTGA